MKKLIATVLIAIALMASGHEMSAQHSFGVIGGFSFTNSNDSNHNKGTNTKYHAGLTYQLKLPLGFSIQPSLLYHVKAANMKNVQDLEGALKSTSGYIEVPVSVQWGPDLVLFRPFLDVTPFVGYGVYTNIRSAAGDIIRNWNESGLNRWEYGLGLGVGLEIWRFQIIGRYNWNFGNLMDAKNSAQDGFTHVVKEAWKGRNYSGVTLSLAFLF